MTAFYFLLGGIVIGVVIGFAHALDRDREHPPEEFDLPSAYQLRAWEKQRLVRGEANRRVS